MMWVLKTLRHFRAISRSYLVSLRRFLGKNKSLLLQTQIKMKALSEINTLLKTTMSFFVSILASIVVVVVMDVYNMSGVLLLATILGLGLLWTYQRHIHTYKIYFNSEQLILKSKKRQRTIELANVEGIQLASSTTRIIGIQFYQHQIEFKNESDTLETVHFFTSELHPLLLEFQALVRSR